MRARHSLLAVAVAAVTFSACSFNDDGASAAPPAPAGARRGGVLRVGITAPGGIDPLDAYEPVGKLISSTMCDTAVVLDPVTGQVREGLARGWVVTKNAITVKLRRGLKFSDGSGLRSTDVNYSLQQLVLPANGSHAAGVGKEFVNEALAAAQTDVLADPTKAPDVALAVSKFDFQVSTRSTNGGALRAFAEPASAPISASAYKDDDAAFRHNPICVGPYVLAKPFKGGERTIKLVRSKSYYGKNVGYTDGGKGYADEIDFTIFDNVGAALAAYQTGQVDVVPVPRDLARQAGDPDSLVSGLATGVEFVGVPLSANGPFASAGVRRALSEAIDREQLVRDVFGPATIPATGFEPSTLSISKGPSLKGKTTKGAGLTGCGDAVPSTANASAAKASLASFGKSVPGFTLEVNNDGVYPALANALAAQWRANLGLDVKVLTRPWEEYVAKAAAPAGFDTPFRIRWSTDALVPTTTYNDRQTYLASLLASGNTDGANWGRWDDRTFEFGLENTVAPLTDVQQRGVAANALAEHLCKEMPMIPLVFDRPTFLVREGVIGSARTTPVGRDGVLLLRELYLKNQS